MVKIAFILDGNATRRIVKKIIGKNPNPTELKMFCEKMKVEGEDCIEAIFYDCAPFSEKRSLPVSGNIKDFSKDVVFQIASRFQFKLSNDTYFRLRKGDLSFDGWSLKEDSLRELIGNPRQLNDNDFIPNFSQKQVDMRIALDITRLTLSGNIQKMLFLTCDSDFIPTIDYAQTNGVDVVLILDKTSHIKEKLKTKCKFRRYVEDFHEKEDKCIV